MKIIELEEKLLNAMMMSNINFLEEVLHDDLMFNIPTGEIISKTMDIENYRKKKIKIDQLSVISQTIKTIHDISIVSMTVNLKAIYNNESIQGKFCYLRIWKDINNSWKIIAGSSFKIS